MRESLSGIQLTGCQPRTLASLHELQESNYRRLRRLAPDLRAMDDSATSRVAGALDMYLLVQERFKYTTTIVLTYCFEAEQGPLLEPNVQIRMYHDARLAEPVGHSRRHAPHAAPCRRRKHASELERQWELSFLQKWLGYCLRQGHLFLSYGDYRGGRTRRRDLSTVD